MKRTVAGLFVECSEVLRLSGVDVPKEFETRVPLLEKQFNIDGQILRDLLVLKTSNSKLSAEEIKVWHHRVVPLLDKVLGWIETNWPMPQSS